MKIQTLQGINLENDVTTVKITFDKKIENGIIEEIKSFHPIFLKSYIQKENLLEIVTKLPFLWEEIAEILNEKIDERELVLEKIKRHIKSMSTISVLHEIDKMNEEITPFLQKEEAFHNFGNQKFNRQYCIGCGKNSAVTVSFSTSKDSQLAKEIQRDKYLTNILLDRLGIQTALWENIESEEHLKKIFGKYKTPLVIKPTSLTGGKGVHTNIKTLDDALKAYKEIKEITDNKRNQTIIQEQIAGEDYRLLVINGKLEATTKRIPAFIIGNGALTVKELVEETNKDPRRNIYNPTHILKPIIIDKALTEFLTEQGLNLEYIPKKSEKVFVRKVASMSQGGITQDFTEKTHKNIKYISESIAQTLKAYVLGIDVICKDISKPLSPENGGIIEVNTMPEAYLNMFPVLGPQRPQIAKKFIDGLLDQSTTKTVAIGGTLEDIKKIARQFKGNTGIYSNKATYINGELVKKNLTTDKAIQSLKINAYLDNLLFHYTYEEAENFGFGFDKINTLFIKKDISCKIRKFSTKLVNNIKEF